MEFLGKISKPQPPPPPSHPHPLNQVLPRGKFNSKNGTPVGSNLNTFPGKGIIWSNIEAQKENPKGKVKGKTSRNFKN
jgi:hypothetical protein